MKRTEFRRWFGAGTCLNLQFKTSGSGMSFSSPLKMLEKYSNLKQKHFLSLVFTGSAKFMPLNDTFFANNSL